MPPTHATIGARGADYQFKCSLALSVPRFICFPTLRLGVCVGDYKEALVWRAEAFLPCGLLSC